MPKPSDFLPVPPWKGPPLPRGMSKWFWLHSSMKEVGQHTIIGGTSEQVKRIKSLIQKCQQKIPKGALNKLTIKFGIPENLYRPGEKQFALYNTSLKTIYLKPDSTEYDFYHELSHYLDDIAGRGIERHAAADRFARKYGISRKKI